MYIIAGLGNPGIRYQGTRHNTGFYVLDLLARAHGIKINKAKHKAILGEGRIGSEKVVLAKPQTFMNLSGESILLLKQWYHTEEDHILVIYDDIDLDPGVLRIRASGSAGTHNGMRSVLAGLRTEDFPRVRIGIGRSPADLDPADYVLSRFPEEEAGLVREACDRAAKGVECVLMQGTETAMSRYNG